MKEPTTTYKEWLDELLAQEDTSWCQHTIEVLREVIAKQKDVEMTCGCDGFYQLFGVHRPGCDAGERDETVLPT